MVNARPKTMTFQSIRKATAWTIVGLVVALAASVLIAALVGILWGVGAVVYFGPNSHRAVLGVVLFIAIAVWAFREIDK
jgi:hypothetical protein